MKIGVKPKPLPLLWGTVFFIWGIGYFDGVYGLTVDLN